ncbi:MAG: BPSS1780 family membrane protein [Burkholderiales bacterium]
MPTDPYAAPKSHVADVPSAGPDGKFIPEGQGVGTGNGWSWIADAWTFTGQQRGTWIGLFVLFAVVVIVLSLIPFLGSLLLALVMPALYGGIMLGCDAQRRGQRMEVGHLFAGFKNHAGKLIGVGVITLLAFVAIFVVIMVIFGFGMMSMMMGGGEPTPEQIQTGMAGMLIAVLVMTGLSIPIYMAIWFSTPLITLNGMQVGAALKTSFFACLKNILPFLIWGVMVFILAIVASIPLMLGWLLLGPVVIASVYTGYRDIFYAH